MLTEDVVPEIAQSFVDTRGAPSLKELQITAGTAAQVQTQCSDFFCPCGAFLGWKQIRLGGRRQSRSHSDLRSLNAQSKTWTWDGATAEPALAVKEEPKRPETGCSRLELLPVEILGTVLCHQLR